MDDGADVVGQGVKKALIGKVLAGGFLGGSFLFLGFFVVFLVILIVLGIINTDGDKVAQNCVDVKSADEICTSITTSDLGTVSVDEYVAGVVSQEVGGMTDDGFNTYKAYAIAARTYALYHSLHGSNGASRDSNGNCSVPKGTAFQDYNTHPDDNIKAAVEETSGMILVSGDQVISSEYDAFAWYKEEGGYFYLHQRDQMIPSSWVRSKRTEDYISWARTAQHGRGMSQNGAWYLALEKKYDYQQILDYYYGSETNYNAELASTKGGGKKCTSSADGEFAFLDHYNLSHEGLKVLDHKLSDSEVKSLNADLNAALDYAGHGNGAAVAAVGQALVYWFEKQGVYLQYRWGGGHDYYTNAGCDLHGTFTFANPNWGSPSCGWDEHNSSHKYYGMDCSGFVSWATRTACNPNFGANVSGNWVGFGSHISLSQAQPGDVIADSGHIQLVIKNNGDGTVYVAEEGGGTSNGSGLVFSLISNSSYHPDYVISMKDWYSKNCTDIHAGNGGSSGKSSGKGKILLLAGHSYSPYCNKATNECRGVWDSTGYAEEKETRTLVKLLKQKLIKQGYKDSDIDIVNELLGENFNDTSTSKSLYVEIMNDTAAYHKIDFSRYKYAIEIHFNGSDTHTASGVCSVCTNGDCGISSGINSKIRSAVKGALGKPDNGVCNIDTHTFNLFKEKGIPFTYLETEYYDNKSAMDHYSNNKEAVAEAIAKVIKDNYP